MRIKKEQHVLAPPFGLATNILLFGFLYEFVLSCERWDYRPYTLLLLRANLATQLRKVGL